MPNPSVYRKTPSQTGAGRGSARLALLALVFLLSGLTGLTGCRGAQVLSAERSAPIGGEFIRCFADGTIDYGFAVVKENMKAQGRYRYSGDTLYFLSDSFRPHFPAGFLPVRGDTLYMENGLHFRVTKNKLR